MQFIYLSLLYLFILLITIKSSNYFKMFDKPAKRKIHKSRIINTGGYSLIIFFLIITKSYEIIPKIDQILIMSFFVFLAGALDDHHNLSPASKLVLILVPVIILVSDGFVINDLGSYEIIGFIKLGKFALPFTVLCVGLLINAINYNDGIDGCCLTQTIITITYLIFLTLNNYYLVKNLFIILIPLLIIFLFNISNNLKFKIFLGDNGSLQLGFICSFLIIYIFNNELIHPSYLIWSVAYVVYEFLTVSILRISKNRKLFLPGKDHFHHYLNLYKKFNHLQTSMIIGIISITFIFMGYFSTFYVGKIFSLILFLFIFIIYFLLRKKIYTIK